VIEWGGKCVRTTCDSNRGGGTLWKSGRGPNLTCWERVREKLSSGVRYPSRWDRIDGSGLYCGGENPEVNSKGVFEGGKNEVRSEERELRQNRTGV
jgi:hypothetical protein